MGQNPFSQWEHVGETCWKAETRITYKRMSTWPYQFLLHCFCSDLCFLELLVVHKGLNDGRSGYGALKLRSEVGLSPKTEVSSIDPAVTWWNCCGVAWEKEPSSGVRRWCFLEVFNKLQIARWCFLEVINQTTSNNTPLKAHCAVDDFISLANSCAEKALRNPKHSFLCFFEDVGGAPTPRGWTEEKRVCPDDGKTYTFEELKVAYSRALVRSVGVMSHRKSGAAAPIKWFVRGIPPHLQTRGSTVYNYMVFMFEFFLCEMILAVWAAELHSTVDMNSNSGLEASRGESSLGDLGFMSDTFEFFQHAVLDAWGWCSTSGKA